MLKVTFSWYFPIIINYNIVFSLILPRLLPKLLSFITVKAYGCFFLTVGILYFLKKLVDI